MLTNATDVQAPTDAPSPRSGARWLTLAQLAAEFADPDRVPGTRQTQRRRGRRIANDLGLTVRMIDGIEFVSRAELDAAANNWLGGDAA